MDKNEALAWIHGRSKFKIKPGLERMEWMAEKLGHPERRVPAIHVAGTNGKGSTTAFLKFLLMEQGYSTGTFTSPYITHFNERISINGVPVPDEDLIALIKKVKPLVEEAANLPIGEPTEFEVITMMSLLYFSEKTVDIMILETGLGGRYDSTNIIHSLVSIITNIGLDHQDILGESYAEIAEQKAGIIKERAAVISGVDQTEAKKIVEETSKERSAPLFRLGEEFSITQAEDEQSFRYKFHHEAQYQISMLGDHQKNNASLAITTMDILKESGWMINRSLYGQALLKTWWPGRMEVVRQHPYTLLDGAHNYEGTLALVKAIETLYRGRTIHVIYGAIAGKPVKEMLNMIKKVATTVTVVTFDFPKALTKNDYQSIDAGLVHYENSMDAYEQVKQEAAEEDIILCTGSLYFISEIRNLFD
ncbi:bifunctional folylpolyglutamate synthase/dihydrofolate synthase [Salimicrobium flavidum]|uniref:Dihydrofolate synthase/folylpolyglutamate synthase n=1 Tax=Salimicrobium flavidum TaxID=570947 RepID=A0A1N7JNE3_9BACI|nr:folylpolyglutamate synthase/dihydrofolate synthase family protein [Salimicrobium flavidum]SIS50781.1 dihydrofolate synthase / folylpolyglutamate synthase [Salimicrobium flavidum]